MTKIRTISSSLQCASDCAILCGREIQRGEKVMESEREREIETKWNFVSELEKCVVVAIKNY